MKISISPKHIILLPGLLAGIYFLYIPFQFWLFDPKIHGISKILLPYYPLLFVPLFAVPGENEFGAKEFFFFIGGFLFVFAGGSSGLHVMMWPGAHWMILAMLSAAGPRFGISSYILVFLTPPFDRGFDTLFGFPLRIYLSGLSTFILRSIDGDAHFSGNTIFFKHDSFTVDPACEGLKMFSALTIVILYLAHDEFKNKKSFIHVSGKIILFYFVPGIIFWIVSNLARIVILVAADIHQDIVLHDSVGILIFMTSSVMPLLMIRHFIFSKITSTQTHRKFECRRNENQFLFRNSFISCSAVLLAAWVHLFPYERRAEASDFYKMDGFQKINHENQKNKGGEYGDISVYQKGRIKLIVKKNLNPVKIGHHPRICWTGVGYKFLFESEIIITEKFKPNGDLRMALLERNLPSGKQYYAMVWWYQPTPRNESIQAPILGIFINSKPPHSDDEMNALTASEIKWRKRKILFGENFQQMNIFIPLRDIAEYSNINSNMKNINNSIFQNIKNENFTIKLTNTL